MLVSFISHCFENLSYHRFLPTFNNIARKSILSDRVLHVRSPEARLRRTQQRRCSAFASPRRRSFPTRSSGALPSLRLPSLASPISSTQLLGKMEVDQKHCKQGENDEEYVLLDLEDVCLQTDIPANAPYILSALDTLNPTLIIGNRLKLIGEYQETIGTCLIFSERDAETVIKNSETGNPSQASGKQIRQIASTHKVLKFRLVADAQIKDAA